MALCSDGRSSGSGGGGRRRIGNPQIPIMPLASSVADAA